MKAIINRNSNFGTLNKVITKNSEIIKLINEGLKNGTAKKIIDTDDTLMYELVKPNIMTAAQKAAKEKFSKAIAYRSKTGVSLKEAFAHVYGKKVGAVKKKAAPKKKAAVKKAVVKKAAPKKKAGPRKKAVVKKVTPVKAAPTKTTVKKVNSITTVSGVKKAAAKKKEAPKKVTGSHKDTKSHNVNIRVMSGIEKFSNSVLDELNFLSNKISNLEEKRDKIKVNIKYKNYSVNDMPKAKFQLKNYNDYIKSLKVNLRNLKKHIK